MAKKQFHKFREVRYEVRYPKRMKDYGDTQSPHTAGTPVMKVSGKLVGLTKLETELHEALHACLWDLDEEAIGETSHDMACFLWDLGYRFINPLEEPS